MACKSDFGLTRVVLTDATHTLTQEIKYTMIPKNRMSPMEISLFSLTGSEATL